MTAKRKGTTSLSRRSFLKTTTVATAAASVGCSPQAGAVATTQPAGSSPQPQWEITGKEIVTFWTEIWPKIVALSWLDPPASPQSSVSYRCAFEQDPAFRVKEAHRIAHLIGVRYNSNIPLCVTSPGTLNIMAGSLAQNYPPHPKALYQEGLLPLEPDHHAPFANFKGWSCPDALWGETYFLITDEGFTLPWPEKPSPDDIFIGYLEGGGILPRINRPYDPAPSPAPAQGPPLPPSAAVPGSELTDREFLFREQLTTWSAPSGINCNSPLPSCKTRGLSGVALITLIEKWPRIVAQAWKNPSVEPDIKNNLKGYIMPEVWTSWPPELADPPGIAPGDDLSLSHSAGSGTINLAVPLPAAPSDAAIFEELVVGHASNPMYSNCY